LAAADYILEQPINPKMMVTNYQSTMHNIPEEQTPHDSVCFARSVLGHGLNHVVITQGRNHENV
jgi:hypothetical protein